MIRSMIVFNVVLLSAGFAQALVPVPIPRLSEAEWEPHIQQAKKATESTPDDDPAKKVERITQAAEDLGERLKKNDTSADTLSKQEQLLKDIDSLLKPPPPMNNGGGGGGDSSKKMNDMNDSPMPPPPMGGGSPMGNPQQKPMGKDGKNGERNKPDRSPRGSDSKPMPMPMPMNGEPMPKGMPMGSSPMKPEPMGVQPMGAKGEPSTGGPGTGGSRTPTTLPLEDSFSKQVWGHLPEKMRQQVSQYYRDQYMPRYSELLKQYYSSLAEREKQGK